MIQCNIKIIIVFYMCLDFILFAIGRNFCKTLLTPVYTIEELGAKTA